METSPFNTEYFIIRNYKPEDIQYIIKRHRELYSKEYDFSSEFGDYVEKYIYIFHEAHYENIERMWLAESDGKPAGVIAIVNAGNSSAQLRWFIVEPDMRGKGLGHKLMKTAIDFCKEKNYKQIFLWTTNMLEAARYLYKFYGFSLTETLDNNTWCKDIIKEEKWELNI